MFSTLLIAFLLGKAQGLPQAPSDPSAAAALAEGLSAQDMNDAFPSRDLADIQNWYGTSLFGWNGCKDKDPTWKEKIIEAYADANKLVNYDEVKTRIDFNSAAALEFLGPSGLNKYHQGNIQGIFANVATVKEGASWYTPNWIRVRCDDPRQLCTPDSDDPDDPECPPASAQGDEQTAETTAYATNPFENGNDKFSEINFCPPFFSLRNLGNAMAYGSGKGHPILNAVLSNYESRADIFLHELFHLDLAAKTTKNGDQNNPRIRDLLIKFKIGSGKDKGKVTTWTKVYGPRLAKILARFQPWRRDQDLGDFIRQSDDSLTMFALALYVQKLFGYYPYIPVIYDQLTELPLIPPSGGGSDDEPDESAVVAYDPGDTDPATFINLTMENGGTRGDPNCTFIYENGSGEDVEIGLPIPKSMYPVSYWEQYDQWIQGIKDSTGSGNNDPTMCRFNITEVWTCEPAESNLYAQVTLSDASGRQIYSTPGSDSSPGVPINDAMPWHLRESEMEEELIIIGEHQNDYMQFYYNSQAWTSSDTSGVPSCQLQSENWPVEGPTCPGEAQVRLLFGSC
ncbi:hypothetical protein O1611_g410 [Lasiodiplodia mahajangana]|uniref:Uncharacterized protein n=1 Tax=Lasiodiplodia mahajangana TaxID=1108764 RepID=A0ACC2K179_9PEZI|nr:hypothetical protein O1611_g410 [Lasiodiplodia mahajangana]